MKYKDIQSTGSDGVYQMRRGSSGEVNRQDWESRNKTQAGIQKNDKEIREIIGRRGYRLLIIS